MNDILRKNIKINTEELELKTIWKELTEIENIVKFKKKELHTIQILNFFKENYLNQEVNIYIECESDGYDLYCYIDPPEESESDGSDLGQELLDYLQIQQEEVGDIYRNNIKEIKFINDEKGRNKIIKMFIGNDWQHWKKEKEVIQNFEKLSIEIPKSKPATAKNKI